jgi:tyrosyl-tRNA synthetase
MADVFNTLFQRGFIKEVTDPGLGGMLARERFTLYAGFDPSASSLHIGNLVPIMGLAHFQRAGHRPLPLVGGATGMVGDPSGKSEERNLLTLEQVRQNAASIEEQIARILRFEGDNAAIMVNNADWIAPMGCLEWLRDVGKHFSVNAMMAKDSVKSRLENRESGISYTEFSYMLIQAYDFMHLFEKHGCRLQVGGSEQWGNITAGIDLIRRVHQQQAYGITFPLIRKADGEKFGKTAAGAVWLDANRTSVWDFYQYWIRIDDRDVVSYLKVFTFLELEDIARLAEDVENRPQERAAQKALAREVTTLVHGAGQTQAMERAAQMIYGQQIRDLSDDQLKAVLADAPSHRITRSSLSEGIPIVDLLVDALKLSKSEARRRLKGGGIYVNNVPVGEDHQVNSDSLASPSCVVLRSGKKNYCLIQVD